MLSPNPISLLCALLLCLPLAILFTITTPLSPSSASSGGSTTRIFPTRFTLKKPISNPNPNPPTLLSRHNTRIFQPSPTTTNSTPPSPSPPPPPSPPPIEYDDEEDNSLFQLASRVNPNPKPPNNKKVAFMFLTTSSLSFAPLWEAFFNNTNKNLYNIYIHADPSFNYSTPFSGVFTHRVIQSKPTRRNSPTLISAARRLIARALLHDKSNYMFALLSQSCIPLHSFKFTYKILTRSKKSFIEILNNEPGAWERWAARGQQAMLPEVKFTEFRIGSQFWILKRKHARVVVRDRRLWGKFKRECLSIDTCYPEEHYFPTLLQLVDSRGCVPTTLTHVDWSESSDGHPRMYGEEEVGPELILALRNDRPRYGDEINCSDSSMTPPRYGDEINSSDTSPKWARRDPFLFARKFSPESIKKLMSFANDVILRD